MTETAATPRTWTSFVSYAGALMLGGVLLVAAWGKLLDPLAFADQIRLEGLDFLLSAMTVAYVALALEVGLGLALVLGLRRVWILVPSSLLVAFFLWLTGRNWYLVANGLRDEGAACGCFGNLVQRSPSEAFWQDLLLLLMPLTLAWFGRGLPAKGVTWRVVVTVVVTLAALIFAVQAPDLPLDNIATRLSPGVKVENLCAGSGAQRVCLDTLLPELQSGEHLVIISSLEEEEFLARVDELTNYALDYPNPRIWVVSTAEMEQRQAFSWQYGPSFEIREVPEAVLKPLYRRTPRTFRVEDGMVTETWSTVAPVTVSGSAP